MPGLAHVVSLQACAGVELQFAEFVSRAAARFPEWSHVLMNPAGAVHPLVRKHLGSALSAEFRAKYWRGVRLPAVPAFARARHCSRRLEQHDARVLLIWNRSARIQFAIDAAGSMPSIHYEHGAAWFGGHETDRRRYFQRVRSCIANSNAAARVLQEYWGFEGDITVCRNAMRPTLKPGEGVAKRFPENRPIRIGVAARLVPVKGVAIALHTLRRLRESRVDAELHIAGHGPESEKLRLLMRDLNLEPFVHFRGIVEDMTGFYASIDCLLHTPLSEAFGLVALEASAHGCPALVAAVDGLPEAVAHGISGICMPVESSLADYVELGGNTGGLPDVVYDPEKDCLRDLGIVSPETAAAAVVDLFSDREAYESLSRSGARHALEAYSFDRYVDELMGALSLLSTR